MRLRVGDRIIEDVDARVSTDRVEVRGGGASASFALARQPDGSVVLDGPTGRHRAWSDGRWVVIDGRARQVSVAPPGAAAKVIPEVSPPMPATVTAIFVAAGDAVARGDRVVAVNAMKTETVLESPRDGSVRAVYCTVGQLVRPGQVLVEIE
jgi:acetyl/propionyl-CoA carboxylase alpha subunit